MNHENSPVASESVMLDDRYTSTTKLIEHELFGAISALDDRSEEFREKYVRSRVSRSAVPLGMETETD
jgi:hypothetical protein